MKISFYIFFSSILWLSSSLFAQSKIHDSILRISNHAEDFRDKIELFSENTNLSGTKFFDYHSGIKKPYLFNGKFAFPYTIGGENYISGRKNAFFHLIQFIPSAEIRIFQNDKTFGDKSKPVRTPSFYPKIHYFLTSDRFWNSDKKLFISMGLGHHSNGQDGTEFVDYTDTVNIYNGSFSESLISYFSVGGMFDKFFHAKNEGCKPLHHKQERSTKRNFRLKTFWKLGFEYHPVYFSNQKFHQTGLYGGNRIFGTVTFLTSKNMIPEKFKTNTFKDFNLSMNIEKNRLSFSFEYITDRSFYSGGFNSKKEIKLFDLEKRMNLNLTYYRRILASKHPAIFAQISYSGSDNYNIYFQKSIFQARIGLAFGFFEYDKIVKNR
jgi:hypothetical protein